MATIGRGESGWGKVEGAGQCIGEDVGRREGKEGRGREIEK